MECKNLIEGTGGLLFFAKCNYFQCPKTFLSVEVLSEEMLLMFICAESQNRGATIKEVKGHFGPQSRLPQPS